ncbi:MAG: glycosyltransferase family 2 protein [Flavobacteriales bacterium]|nr:glycosyltransferase family 2 protein [Flavobacteriales bacterium]
MIDLSIIIPAYNEEKRITDTLVSMSNYLLRQEYHYEILVVDDGSSDKTVRVVQALQLTVPNIRILALERNQGKGAAVRKGMLEAKGSIRLFSDADGATPIEELEKVIHPICSGEVDIAIGSRYLENSDVQKKQPRYRVIWSRLVNKMVQRFLLPGIVDPHCGFKAFTATSAEALFQRSSINEWSFDLEILAMAKKMGFDIKEIPVKWIHDERSKGRISQLPTEIKNVYRIKKRLSKCYQQ